MSVRKNAGIPRRLISVASGLLFFTLALFTPALRRSDFWLDPLAWALALGVLLLTLIGAARRTPWQRCAVLLAVALMGQTCALAIVNAPNYGVVQHYLPWRDLFSSPRGLFLLGPFVQSVIVVGAVWQARGAIEARLRRLLTISDALILTCVTIFAAAYGSWDLLRYVGEVGLSVWILTVNAVTLILVAAAIPADTLNAAVAWIQRNFVSAPTIYGALHPWDRFFPWAVAMVVTIVSASLASVIFERIPHIPDEVAYLFQAKYFSSGRLYLPAPPDAAAFALPHTINDGSKWYSIFPPGWPAVLAIGVWLGKPWLVNPLLSGCAVLLIHILISNLYTRQFAHAVVSLLAVSPMFLFMSASFMAHPLSLVLSLVALVGVHNARESAKTWWAGIAGLGLGGLALTRPFEGVLIGIPVGLWALGVGARRLTLPALLVFGSTSVTVGGIFLPYNRSLTGQATYDPITKYFDETYYPGSNRLGFGHDVGNVGWPHLDPLPGHGPLDVIVNAHQNIYNLNVELFGWSFGSLCFLVLFLSRPWRIQADSLFLSIILAVVGGHSLYWFSGGPDFGARYWYQALIPLVVLTARGIQEVQRRWSEADGTPLDRSRITAFVIAASLVAAVTFIPWRGLGKYRHYRGMRADMVGLARAHEFGHSLVFIQERNKSDYPSAAIFNPPKLDLPGTIYARDTGPAGRATVAQSFPNRPIWIVGGSPVLGGPFTVVAGPLPPRSDSPSKSFAEHP